MADLSNFPENTTKVFSGVITHNGTNPDTTSDEVRFMMKAKPKDTDAEAKINVIATGLGVGGIFTFTLTQAITEIPVGVYFWSIVWTLSGDASNYVLKKGKVSVLNKQQDNI